MTAIYGLARGGIGTESPMAVACPSSTECVGAEDEQNVIVFNPQSPSNPITFQVEPALTPQPGYGSELFPLELDAIACPTVAQCTVVDAFGDETTFNPKIAASGSRHVLDPDKAGPRGGAISINAIACPTASSCTALDTRGKEITFNPHDGRVTTRTRIMESYDPATDLSSPDGIACPTKRQCTAIGGDGEVTFNPIHPSSASRVKISGNGLSAVSCPSAAQCTIVGLDGELTLDPKDTGNQPYTPYGY